MGVNIANPDIERLANELAAVTGEDVTSAVRSALQEKLQRLSRVTEKRKRIQEILDALPPPPPGVTSDHSDLYDEWGLPK
ncbi:type II toxin-antitoxin system VapB family antitoxin [Aquibium sp. ELW1220]|jgi:antitoxin VapB|uniref:type II toxin-antitoxin system VapB family antitoxin n=1 Tax=Aquibium sp. ELW1220 TaxID=2976766 RepID=UPI0025AFCA39|nr:type II toxin-antitoxin system VapB family antitoxin [Aquibium sp. ELW1220]MDN2578877.1 type II toxin-antitoxin system VapB family antitoxin [Aquibium sp. ELW1220]